jgi:phosphatidylglycerol lysyltransferase
MMPPKTAPPSSSFPRYHSLRQVLAPLVALLLFTVAIFIILRILKPYKLREIQQAFHAIPGWRIGLCLFFTSLSYTVLSGYDTLAFRYLGKQLSYGKIALTSFLSYAFANNTGSLSIITSGSVRFRLYGGWGLSGLEVARIIGFSMLTFWLGTLLLAGITLLSHPLALPSAPGTFVPLVERLGGIVCLLLVGGYLVLSFMRKKPLQLKKMEIPVPAPSFALAQLVMSSVDLLCYCGALFVLMPFSGSVAFLTFVGICLLAFIIGLISNVPGGLGVFEGAILLLVGPFAEGPQIVGALLIFRVIYYLLPLGISVIILGALELARRRAGIARFATGLYAVVSTLLPQLLALATFAAGAILLFSGSLPAIGSRLEWLGRIVPLPVLELSHFLNSVVGSCLLVLAIGLRRRLDMAYLASCAMLFAGIVFSLFKGLDFEEAILLTVLLVVLYSSREQFYRKASLLAEPLSAGWVAAIILVLAASLWLGFFAYRHQDYSADLWWRFALHGQASRFLRATVGIAATMLFFALLSLFRPAQPRPAPPTGDELLQAEKITRRAGDTRGYLALLGDKSLLFSAARDAFIMYGVRGQSWIAVGEPIGNEGGWEELLWRFRDLCEHYGGWPVFYEIGRDHLAQYVDLGLKIIKIGEEGRVFLPEFSLEGGSRKGLRYIHNRLVKEGFSFEIVQPPDIEPLLPVLSDISSSWIGDKNTAEKGFSLGFFKEDYLRRFPVAVVKKDEKILAFANLWPGGAGLKELSLDLMRYLSEAPRGIMDYLFISIMLWGKVQGYQWFSFGMTPLAGLERQKVASLWSNIGAFVYRHGEHFYNFQGLREYKDKFDPEWEARYLAYPQAFSLPVIFVNLSTLIGGGVKGLLRR